MTRYHNIHCKIWNDDKFPFISDDCKLVFFHLLTTPYSTPFGLFKAPVEALAAELRWDFKRYSKAFQEAFKEGFVKYDSKYHLIYIPNFLKYNRPYNTNVLISWIKIYDELPNCHLKDEFYQSFKVFMEAVSEAFQKAFQEHFEKPSRKVLVTDTDTVTASDTDTDTEEKGGMGEKTSIPYKEIISYLNQQLKSTYRHTTPKTRDLINARYKEGFTLEDFKTVIDKKIKHWGINPDMIKYLRPETLFGTKFESYLNERELDPSISKHKGAVDWLKEKEAEFAEERS